MDRLSEKRYKRSTRRRRVRKKIIGTAHRPRLSVFRSSRNISVQAVDDTTGTTLASASTLEKEFADVSRSIEGGKAVGRGIAERLESLKVKRVIFDRNGYRYHGIVKAVADAARESGLEF